MNLIWYAIVFILAMFSLVSSWTQYHEFKKYTEETTKSTKKNLAEREELLLLIEEMKDEADSRTRAMYDATLSEYMRDVNARLASKISLYVTRLEEIVNK